MDMGVVAIIKKERNFLIWLFLLSFFVRVMLFFTYTRHDAHAWLGFDSIQYHTIAIQIAQGNGIMVAKDRPNFYRLPGYPLYLSGFYKLFGDITQKDSIAVADNFPQGETVQITQTPVYVQKALWGQIFIASFIPVLICILSLLFFPSAIIAARVAGIVSSLHLGFVLYAGIVSTEALFLFFFLLFLICFFSVFRWRWCRSDYEHNPLLPLFMAGIFLGVASLLRAVGHCAIVLLVLMLFMSSLSLNQKLKGVVCFVVGWLLIVGGWLIRNYALAGTLFFHTLPGLHFLQYSAVYTVMDVDHSDYFTAKKKVFSVWDAEVKSRELLYGRALSEYERFNVAESLAKKYCFSYPLISTKHALIQMARTCGTLYSTLLLYVPSGTVYGDDASFWFKIKLYLFPRVQQSLLIPLIYVELIMSLFLILGFLFFLMRLLFDVVARCAAASMFPLMAFLIGITLAYGCARLRMPVEPFLIIMASYAWVTLWQKKI
jgi:hypothetical protein